MTEPHQEKRIVKNGLTKSIAMRDAEISHLTDENAELRAMNERWIMAATNNYPGNWAMDPGNPELTCANIREVPQAMADGYKAALQKTTADRDALAKRVRVLEGALKEAEVMMRAARSLVPDARVYDAVLAEVQAALTPPAQQHDTPRED